jgi:hypothetical protein
MTRNRKKRIHENTLKPSILVSRSPIGDIGMLCHAYPKLSRYAVQIDRQWDVSMLEMALLLEEKFLELSGTHQRINGYPIQIPEEMRSAMVKWRTLFLRYKNSDFRHTDGERKAMAELGQWTADEYRKLRNQEPVTLDLLGEK